jgi:hypothetical protein
MVKIWLKQYMVDKLGIEVDSHDFFNFLLFYTKLFDECEKVSAQPIDMWDIIGTRMVHNEHHDSYVAKIQLSKLETQITKVLDTQFATQLVDI